MRNEDLAAALRYVRDSRHLSQQDVVDATGIARSTIAKIEAGKADMSAMTLGTLERLDKWISGRPQK